MAMIGYYSAAARVFGEKYNSRYSIESRLGSVESRTVKFNVDELNGKKIRQLWISRKPSIFRNGELRFSTSDGLVYYTKMRNDKNLKRNNQPFSWRDFGDIEVESISKIVIIGPYDTIDYEIIDNKGYLYSILDVGELKRLQFEE